MRFPMLEQTMADKDKKKIKYLSKTVKFAGKSMTLYSLDGMTWSSRKDELHQILARQEQERAAFNQMIGDAATKAKSAETTEEGAPEESRENEEIMEMDDLDVIEDVPVVDTPPKGKGRGAGAKAEKAAAAPAAKEKPGKQGRPIVSPKARASLKATPKKSSKPKAKRRVA
ncbi:MAG: hypothetical protein K1X79_04395 [Oligoflexia bacterium]|nr:hypothetical protein [Oligoflexia bacterium]